MNKLDDILTLATVGLLLGIYIVSFVFRRFVEALWPAVSTKTPVTRAQRVWEEVVLPSFPAFLGLVFCLACPSRLFPYPAVVGASWVSRALYGIGTGWFASWGYKVLKFVLQKKWNIPFPDDSNPPAPGPKTNVIVPPNDPPKLS